MITAQRQMVVMFSEIAQWVTPGIKYISFDIHPEGDKKIYNYRGSHGKERNINEIFSDGGSSNTHFFANSAAHTEHMPFNKMFKTLHTVKIKK